MKVRKAFALATLILSLNTGVFGQQFSKNDVVKHKIKSVTLLNEQDQIIKTFEYDEHGNLVSTGHKTIGSTLTKKELIYDDQKLLIEERNFNPLGDLHFTHKFTYNGSKQLVKKEAFDSNNKVESTWEYEYDDNDHVIKETQTSEVLGNNLTRYKYRRGRLTEEETSNEILGKEEKISFSYDDNDQLIEQTIRSYFTNTTSTITFTYNSHGKLTRQVEKTESGQDGETTFEYDEKGLLTKQTTKSLADNQTEITTYKIEYF